MMPHDANDDLHDLGTNRLLRALEQTTMNEQGMYEEPEPEMVTLSIRVPKDREQTFRSLLDGIKMPSGDVGGLVFACFWITEERPFASAMISGPKDQCHHCISNACGFVVGTLTRLWQMEYPTTPELSEAFAQGFIATCEGKSDAYKGHSFKEAEEKHFENWKPEGN